MTSQPNPELPVARLRTPGDIVAVVPHLLGYQPSDALVALSLHGRRSRIGLTLCLSLPGPGEERWCAREVVRRIRADEGSDAVFIVYDDKPPVDDTLPHAELVGALLAAARRDGVGLRDALVVSGGRWRSYVCAEPTCCPPEGTPVPEVAESPEVGLVAAEMALTGQRVLPSRDALAESLRPITPLGPELVAQRLDQVAAELADDVDAQGREAMTGRLTRVLALVSRFEDEPAELTDDEAALVAVALFDVALRDRVMGELGEREDALFALLLQVCRRTVPPYDAPVCSVLAWVAYARGSGALANLALDRALMSEPDYSLARLLIAAIAQQIHPREIRRITRDTCRG